MPGVVAVAADCMDHGEEVPPQFEKVFSVA